MIARPHRSGMVIMSSAAIESCPITAMPAAKKATPTRTSVGLLSAIVWAVSDDVI